LKVYKYFTIAIIGEGEKRGDCKTEKEEFFQGVFDFNTFKFTY